MDPPPQGKRPAVWATYRYLRDKHMESLDPTVRAERLKVALGFCIAKCLRPRGMNVDIGIFDLWAVYRDGEEPRWATKEEKDLWQALLALPEQAFEKAVRSATERRTSQEGGGGAEGLSGGRPRSSAGVVREVRKKGKAGHPSPGKEKRA